MNSIQETRKLLRELANAVEQANEAAMCLDAHLDDPDNPHGLGLEKGQLHTAMQAVIAVLDLANSTEQSNLRALVEDLDNSDNNNAPCAVIRYRYTPVFDTANRVPDERLAAWVADNIGRLLPLEEEDWCGDSDFELNAWRDDDDGFYLTRFAVYPVVNNEPDTTRVLATGVVNIEKEA